MILATPGSRLARLTSTILFSGLINVAGDVSIADDSLYTFKALSPKIAVELAQAAMDAGDHARASPARGSADRTRHIPQPPLSAAFRCRMRSSARLTPNSRVGVVKGL